ncbi:cephalosporin esterase [Crepidotus variabilis]|uniref:Carboxylic ester hydrolase n=1 Tax=Crepidotus variabilis TaxID=179855 RepID=A0A9P6EPR7_9AGAR|nr:cephalosporin esterase [Crepidotus variabilis]
MFTRNFARAQILLSIFLRLDSAFASPTDGSSAAALPTVNLGYATYTGGTYTDPFTSKINTQFLGIRYAAPPTASLRFAAPQKPATISGTQAADKLPAACYQASSGSQPQSPFRQGSQLSARQFSPPVVNEDCLFVNVYIPGNLGDNKSLPVIVWIHGGGYISGSAADNGNDLIRASNGGVIAVTVQYRLGVFGFLAGQKVKDGGALNAGLLDQQFALQWVQANIQKFGGDPQKVTIWGESAGAGSVIQHIVANGGETDPPLFRAAITSSTFLPSQYFYNDRIPEALYTQTVAAAGCSKAKDTLQCLRTVNIVTLENANNVINQSGFYGTFTSVPVVDGVFITERPSVLIKDGRVNGNAYLGITNIDEGSPFVNQTLPVVAPTTPLLYAANLFPDLSLPQALAVSKEYSTIGTTLQQANAMMTDSIFLCPTYYLLQAFEQKGAYKGEFAIPPGTHGSDYVYYFPNGKTMTPAFNNQPFIKAFSQSFANFWLGLNPNIKWDPSNITPAWKAWTSSSKTEMHFGQTSSSMPDIRPITSSDALLNRCDFWVSISDATAQ